MADMQGRSERPLVPDELTPQDLEERVLNAWSTPLVTSGMGEYPSRVKTPIIFHDFGPRGASDLNCSSAVGGLGGLVPSEPHRVVAETPEDC